MPSPGFLPRGRAQSRGGYRGRGRGQSTRGERSFYAPNTTTATKRPYDQSFLASGLGPDLQTGPAGAGQFQARTNSTYSVQPAQANFSNPLAHNPNSWYDASISSRGVKSARGDQRGPGSQAMNNYSWPPTALQNNTQPVMLAPTASLSTMTTPASSAFSQPPPSANGQSTITQPSNTRANSYFSDNWNQ